MKLYCWTMQFMFRGALICLKYILLTILPIYSKIPSIFGHFENIERQSTIWLLAWFSPLTEVASLVSTWIKKNAREKRDSVLAINEVSSSASSLLIMIRFFLPKLSHISVWFISIHAIISHVLWIFRDSLDADSSIYQY